MSNPTETATSSAIYSSQPEEDESDDDDEDDNTTTTNNNGSKKKVKLIRRVGDNSLSNSCVGKLISRASNRRRSDIIHQIRTAINDKLLEILEYAIIKAPGSKVQTAITEASIVEAIKKAKIDGNDWDQLTSSLSVTSTSIGKANVDKNQ